MKSLLLIPLIFLSLICSAQSESGFHIETACTKGSKYIVVNLAHPSITYSPTNSFRIVKAGNNQIHLSPACFNDDCFTEVNRDNQIPKLQFLNLNLVKSSYPLVLQIDKNTPIGTYQIISNNLPIRTFNLIDPIPAVENFKIIYSDGLKDFNKINLSKNLQGSLIEFNSLDGDYESVKLQELELIKVDDNVYTPLIENPNQVKNLSLHPAKSYLQILRKHVSEPDFVPFKLYANTPSFDSSNSIKIVNDQSSTVDLKLVVENIFKAAEIKLEEIDSSNKLLRSPIKGWVMIDQVSPEKSEIVHRVYIDESQLINNRGQFYISIRNVNGQESIKKRIEITSNSNDVTVSLVDDTRPLLAGKVSRLNFKLLSGSLTNEIITIRFGNNPAKTLDNIVINTNDSFSGDILIPKDIKGETSFEIIQNQENWSGKLTNIKHFNSSIYLINNVVYYGSEIPVNIAGNFSPELRLTIDNNSNGKFEHASNSDRATLKIFSSPLSDEISIQLKYLGHVVDEVKITLKPIPTALANVFVEKELQSNASIMDFSPGLPYRIQLATTAYIDAQNLSIQLFDKKGVAKGLPQKFSKDKSSVYSAVNPFSNGIGSAENFTAKIIRDGMAIQSFHFFTEPEWYDRFSINGGLSAFEFQLYKDEDPENSGSNKNDIKVLEGANLGFFYNPYVKTKIKTRENHFRVGLLLMVNKVEKIIDKGNGSSGTLTKAEVRGAFAFNIFEHLTIGYGFGASRGGSLVIGASIDLFDLGSIFGD